MEACAISAVPVNLGGLGGLRSSLALISPGESEPTKRGAELLAPASSGCTSAERSDNTSSVRISPAARAVLDGMARAAALGFDRVPPGSGRVGLGTQSVRVLASASRTSRPWPLVRVPRVRGRSARRAVLRESGDDVIDVDALDESA